MNKTLLPEHSSPMMQALDLAFADRLSKLDPFIDGLGEKFTGPQPALMPYLIRETGLGMLSPYVDNLYDLYDQGLDWLKIRGEETAIYQGLGFIGYGGTLEKAPSRRWAWADDQIELDRLPDSQDDLPRIDGVVSISNAARSKLFRTYRGYDYRAAELSYSRLGECILGDDSGVYVAGSSAKWSFGERFEFALTLGRDDLEPLGIYLEPGDGVTWQDLAVPWNEVDVAWQDLGGGSAERLMARALANMGAYIGFYGADGSLLGARRAKVCKQVAGGSIYRVLDQGLIPSTDGVKVYVEALTGFADGAGEEASEAAILFAAKPKEGLPPAKFWLEPDQLDAPHTANARIPLELSMTATKRDCIKFLISFN